MKGCLLTLPSTIAMALATFPLPAQAANHDVRINCVVDGDTIWVGGVKIRLADIDAPETHPPRCAREARLGARATSRLVALLNAGPFSMTRVKRDRDRYGRTLRIARRGGKSIGGVLVLEGLARWYDGRRHPWC